MINHKNIINVFNYSKNTKYEKDMANELFRNLIYIRGIKFLISSTQKNSSFFIDIINALNSNEFFLYKYKTFLNYFKNFLYNQTIKII